jgi:hypothetical protein
MSTRRGRRRRPTQATLFDAPPNDRTATTVPAVVGPAVPPQTAMCSTHDGPDNRSGGRDAGMNTAEYAVGTLAAVAFAGILLKVVTSDSVQAALAGVVQRALG